MMALAVIIGVGSAVGGLLLSYPLNTASGSTIVLLSTLVFFGSAMVSPRRRRAVGSLLVGTLTRDRAMATHIENELSDRRIEESKESEVERREQR